MNTRMVVHYINKLAFWPHFPISTFWTDDMILFQSKILSLAEAHFALVEYLPSVFSILHFEKETSPST